MRMMMASRKMISLMNRKITISLEMKKKAKDSLNTSLAMEMKKESSLKSSWMRLLNLSLENPNREFIDFCKIVLYK